MTLLLTLLLACTPEPRLEGHVYDIWEQPIDGATVVLDGVSERPLTDGSGRFSLPLVVGEQTVKAGKEGYIQDHAAVTVVEGQPVGEVKFYLYKKPEEVGFYAKGISDYVHLAPQAVYQFRTDLEVVRGIRELGVASVDDRKLQVVFHTPLKLDQVGRLGLRLHKLAYTPTARMLTPTGEADVEVNLYTSGDDVKIDVQPMRSKTDYLVTVEGELEAGKYAFDTQGLLSGGEAATFDEVPEPLRVAFPFEVK